MQFYPFTKAKKKKDETTENVGWGKIRESVQKKFISDDEPENLATNRRWQETKVEKIKLPYLVPNKQPFFLFLRFFFLPLTFFLFSLSEAGRYNLYGLSAEGMARWSETPSRNFQRIHFIEPFSLLWKWNFRAKVAGGEFV